VGERVHTTTWSTLLGCGATHTTPTSPPAVVCARAHTVSAVDDRQGGMVCTTQCPSRNQALMTQLSSVHRHLCRQSTRIACKELFIYSALSSALSARCLHQAGSKTCLQGIIAGTCKHAQDRPRGELPAAAGRR
jgi:hypothetical protein